MAFPKLKKDLYAIDITDYVKSKKFLEKLYYHIKFYIDKRNLAALKATSNLLEEFLSANKSQFHQGVNSSDIYKVKRFIATLERFIRHCKSGDLNGR